MSWMKKCRKIFKKPTKKLLKIMPNRMAEENSDNRRIDVENKDENDVSLILNNTDIHHEDNIEESQLSTTPSNSIELISGEDHSSDLYPDTKGSPAEEHVSEKENYETGAIAIQNTQDADEKSSSLEIETNVQHEKVDKLEDGMTSKTEPILLKVK
ncbi:hypothetical protein WA026_002436 [Henosepilachna vigintioctopunctata]|uniref:Uncharacterized protein n=1 Tax=Henosepilachna vigintioctopunctata TaxID=420089 RepID=A0AAW1TZP4_9CUCU